MFPKLSLPAGLTLNNYALSARGKLLGIVNPGIILSTISSESTHYRIYGPRGSSVVKESNILKVLSALIVTGNLLSGTDEAIEQTNEYLLNPRTSRTTSYLCSIAKTCDDVVSAFTTWGQAVVGVIGCGGIGSLSALLLAGSGIKNFLLVDPDTIEESNLNRQLFWTLNDIGRSKVDVLEECLNLRFRNLEIHKCQARLSAKTVDNYISMGDAFLFTADEPVGIVREGNQAAKKQSKLFINAGFVLNDLMVGSDYASDIDHSIQFATIGNSIMPSFGPNNAEAAGIASSLLLLKLAKLSEGNDTTQIWKPHTWPRQTSLQTIQTS